MWALVSGVGCREERSVRPFVPAHVRLLLRSDRWLEGWVLLPAGLIGTKKLGDTFYWFGTKKGDPRRIEVDLTTSDFNQSPDEFDRDPEDFARTPCRAWEGHDTVTITRREETTDAVQVVCDHRTPAGREWRQITRVQRFDDVLLECEVRGSMTDGQLADAWNICATMHLALLDETPAMTCSSWIDKGFSPRDLWECDWYFQPPSD